MYIHLAAVDVTAQMHCVRTQCVTATPAFNKAADTLTFVPLKHTTESQLHHEIYNAAHEIFMICALSVDFNIVKEVKKTFFRIFITFLS